MAAHKKTNGEMEEVKVDLHMWLHTKRQWDGRGHAQTAEGTRSQAHINARHKADLEATLPALQHVVLRGIDDERSLHSTPLHSTPLHSTPIHHYTINTPLGYTPLDTRTKHDTFTNTW